MNMKWMSYKELQELYPSDSQGGQEEMEYPVYINAGLRLAVYRDGSIRSKMIEQLLESRNRT